MAGLIWTFIIILFALWLLGFFFLHIAGNLIFLLLVVALVGVIFNLLGGAGTRHVHTTEVERRDV